MKNAFKTTQDLCKFAQAGQKTGVNSGVFHTFRDFFIEKSEKFLFFPVFCDFSKRAPALILKKHSFQKSNEGAIFDGK
ncbi:MAG: hypothetical protein A2Y12_11370 [Planctomycetes bacterium GWF2_42_9]|nr:MAG: hypothetical protein A2Y12_11370 [Planctomycetes bacterium GWF2_42_9]HAL44470.1 hypothetical protein [Phycisphaerales bacterium]